MILLEEELCQDHLEISDAMWQYVYCLQEQLLSNRKLPGFCELQLITIKARAFTVP